MLLITERVLITGSSLRREDPAPHGDLSQIPDLYAGDVRSSQFLFIFQESELPQLDTEIKKKTSNARAGDRHIFEYMQKNQKPEKDWKVAEIRLPVLRGTELFVRCYRQEKQPGNLIAITNISINELIRHPLKTGGECIGNHSLNRFYDEVMKYMEQHVEGLSTFTSNPKRISVVLARLRANWEIFEIANKGNDYFSPKNAEYALSKLNSLEKRIGVEVLALKDGQKLSDRWIFKFTINIVFGGLLVTLLSAWLLRYFG